MRGSNVDMSPETIVVNDISYRIALGKLVERQPLAWSLDDLA
jgi:hypothetical protein